MYQNRTIKDHIMVMFQGLLYIIQVDDVSKKLSMIIPPISFLDEVLKIIYSEKFDKYLALRLRDMRKT